MLSFPFFEKEFRCAEQIG